MIRHEAAPVVFVDCETTGLDPDRHEIWELAVIGRERDSWFSVEIMLPVDLTVADPNALRIGQYYERRTDTVPVPSWRWSYGDRDNTGRKYESLYGGSHAAAKFVARVLDGNHIVGAVPSFDAAFLKRWLNQNGQAATWHYHLIDVEAYAAGALATGSTPADLPWDSDELSHAVGVDPDQFDRHTALGDALWAAHIYAAVALEAFHFGHPPVAGYLEVE